MRTRILALLLVASPVLADATVPAPASSRGPCDRLVEQRLPSVANDPLREIIRRALEDPAVPPWRDRLAEQYILESLTDARRARSLRRRAIEQLEVLARDPRPYRRGDEVLFRLGALLTLDDNLAEARPILRTLVERYPRSRRVADARQVLAQGCRRQEAR